MLVVAGIMPQLAGADVYRAAVPTSINSAGVITDPTRVRDAYHGFVRAADGTITAFAVPGGATTPSQGTFPQVINTAGEILRIFIRMSNDVPRAFVRAGGSLFRVGVKCESGY